MLWICHKGLSLVIAFHVLAGTHIPVLSKRGLITETLFWPHNALLFSVIKRNYLREIRYYFEKFLITKLIRLQDSITLTRMVLLKNQFECQLSCKSLWPKHAEEFKKMYQSFKIVNGEQNMCHPVRMFSFPWDVIKIIPFIYAWWLYSV